MDITEIMNYLKPELLILIPVCWGIGYILKSSPKCANAVIAPMLGIISTCMAAMWVFAQSPIESYQDALMALFSAIAQGLIASLMANLTYDKYIHPLGSSQESQGGDADEDAESGK